MRREPALAVAVVATLAACGDWKPPAAGFVLAAAPAWTTEAGGTAVVDVSLALAPTAPVVVDVLTGDATEGAIVDAASGQPITWSTLVFTPADWSTPQRVTVVGIDDDARDGDVPWQLMLLPSSADEGYATLDAGRVTFTNRDDETPAIRLSRSVLETWEARRTTASFTVVLAARPVSTVTVPLVSARPEEGRLRSSTAPMIADLRIELVFTPSDWSTPREVIVVAQADGIADGDQTYVITVGPATGDGAYAAVPAQTVTVTNRDVDGLGVVCDRWLPDAWNSAAILEGQSLTFGCVLRGRPAADVEIPFVSSDPSEVLVSTGGGTPASPLTLVFTPENWSAVQFVTLHGVEDHLWEPWAAAPTAVQAGPLRSADGAYQSIGWSATFNLTVCDIDVEPPLEPPPDPLPPP